MTYFHIWKGLGRCRVRCRVCLTTHCLEDIVQGSLEVTSSVTVAMAMLYSILINIIQFYLFQLYAAMNIYESCIGYAASIHGYAMLCYVYVMLNGILMGIATLLRSAPMILCALLNLTSLHIFPALCIFKVPISALKSGLWSRPKLGVAKDLQNR